MPILPGVGGGSAKLQDSIVLRKGTSWNFLTRIVTVE